MEERGNEEKSGKEKGVVQDQESKESAIKREKKEWKEGGGKERRIGGGLGGIRRRGKE